MMTILHFVRDLDTTSGGPSVSVVQLCQAQSRLDGIRVVLTARTSPDPVKVETSDSLAVRWLDGKGRGAEATFDRPFVHNGGSQTIVHVHGLWDRAGHRASCLARSHRLPLVVSVRGMLDPWCFHHKRWKKQFGWWLYQGHNLRRASLLHATSPAEADSFRRMGLGGIPIAIVPNGITPPADPDRFRCAEPRRRELLFLGRFHPIKGLEALLDAWAMAAPAGWTLHLAGPDSDGYRQTLENRVQVLDLGQTVVFSDALRGEEKWRHLACAGCVILPSFSENFGMVVAEALAAGTPAATSTATPWECLEHERAGWRFAPEPAAIARFLGELATTTPADLDAMGRRGRELAIREFCSDTIAGPFVDLYRNLAS